MVTNLVRECNICGSIQAIQSISQRKPVENNIKVRLKLQVNKFSTIKIKSTPFQHRDHNSSLKDKIWSLGSWKIINSDSSRSLRTYHAHVNTRSVWPRIKRSTAILCRQIEIFLIETCWNWDKSEKEQDSYWGASAVVDNKDQKNTKRIEYTILCIPY